jgi:hypothetical protein
MAGLLTGLGGFNNTSLPWPLKSSRDFAETPAHYQTCVQPVVIRQPIRDFRIR